MRILITGRDGQVARSLQQVGTAAGHVVLTAARPELDLGGSADAIADVLAAASPDVIVNAAAYTAVDQAEQEADLAFAINARGAEAVAKGAAALGVPLLHLSTDYVFDGTKTQPYVEDDPTCPTSVYGASKLAGEQAVLGAHDNATILRTAWVHSPFGRNFVKTMLAVAKDRSEVRVVADQVGNPTSAQDIAAALVTVAENLLASEAAELRGCFHLVAPDEGSWADLAEHVFECSSQLGGPSAAVVRITTDQYPTPARRPANSRLDCSRLAREHGIRLPSWRPSASDVVTSLIQPQKAGTQAS